MASLIVELTGAIELTGEVTEVTDVDGDGRPVYGVLTITTNDDAEDVTNAIKNTLLHIKDNLHEIFEVVPTVTIRNNTIQVRVDQDRHDRFIREHFFKIPNTDDATRYFYTIFETLWRQFAHHFMWVNNTTKWRDPKVIISPPYPNDGNNTSPWKIQVSRMHVQTALEEVFEKLKLTGPRQDASSS